jgi:hypothetical protein
MPKTLAAKEVAMSAVESLRDLTGRWAGTSLLLLPDEPARESQSTLEIGSAARDKFTTIAYTWEFDGEPQEGMLVLGQEGGSIHGFWIDSWHMGDKLMTLRGASEAGAVTVLRGSYAVENSPDWGWRIDLGPADGALRVAMYNVSPDGEEFLGVDATYAQPT